MMMLFILSFKIKILLKTLNQKSSSIKVFLKEKLALKAKESKVNNNIMANRQIFIIQDQFQRKLLMIGLVEHRHSNNQSDNSAKELR